MERNEEASWRQDMRLLAGEGFLWAEHSTLDYTDALFLETWVPLGVAWRYAWADREAVAGFERECREVLRGGDPA